MTRRRAAAVIAAAVLLLGAGATAAEAGGAGDGWTTTVKCATGAFTAQWTGEDDYGQPARWVAGWIEPCNEPAPTDHFGVIYYTGGQEKDEVQGYVHLGRLRDYDTTTRRTTFSGVVDRGIERYGPLLGICVAYDDGAILGCWGASPYSPTQNPEPPPPVERFAAAPVTQVPESVSTNPNCGSCL